MMAFSVSNKDPISGSLHQFVVDIFVIHLEIPQSKAPESGALKDQRFKLAASPVTSVTV